MRTERLAKMGLVLALGMILSYVEVLIPIVPSVPGVKIGLANALVILLLYRYGAVYGILYQVLRIALTALLFGDLFRGIYSLAGALVSFVIMLLLKKSGFLDIPGISMFGGVAHNLGQLAVACYFVANTAVLWYLPVLLIAGAVSGYLMGIVSEILLKRRLL